MSPSKLRALRHLLKSHLHEVLAIADELLDGNVSVKERDDLHSAEIVVGPISQALTAVAGGQLPGNWFSPLESAVWQSLGGGPLGGKAIADACAQEYNSPFRYILRNLVERKVLAKVRGGYSRALLRRHSEAG